MFARLKSMGLSIMLAQLGFSSLLLLKDSLPLGSLFQVTFFQGVSILAISAVRGQRSLNGVGDVLHKIMLESPSPMRSKKKSS
jgi:hypothetical protein